MLSPIRFGLLYVTDTSKSNLSPGRPIEARNRIIDALGTLKIDASETTLDARRVVEIETESGSPIQNTLQSFLEALGCATAVK